MDEILTLEEHADHIVKLYERDGFHDPSVLLILLCAIWKNLREDS